jgi:hypothetical protein
LAAKVILTYAAGNNSPVAQQVRDIGKICRSAAEFLARRKQVPQQFAESDYRSGVHALHLLSHNVNSMQNQFSAARRNSRSGFSDFLIR